MFPNLFKPSKTDYWYRSENWDKEHRELFELKLNKSRGNDNKAQYMRIKATYMSYSSNPKIRKAARDLFKRVTDDYPEEDFSVIEAYYQLGISYESEGDIKNAEKYYRECIAYKKNLKRKSVIFVPVEQKLADLLANSNKAEKRKEAKAILEDLYTRKDLTDEEMKILKILSKNNSYQLQSLVERPFEKIKEIINNYYQRKPVIDSLNAAGIKIKDLDYFLYPDYKKEINEKSLTILADWLKKDHLSDDAKSTIIHVLINFPTAKKYIFDSVLERYKSADPNYINKLGYKTGIPIELGNAVIRWVDDTHAETVFSLLKSKKFRDDGWLISSMANFKKTENVKRATALVVKKLEESNLSNAQLWTFINILRKLKAVKTKMIIYPFTNFPHNYKRTIKLDPKKVGYTSDGEVKAEAKKAIAKFDKHEVTKLA